MRAPIRTALIAGGAVIALSLGTASALAATRADDGPRVAQDDHVSAPRPVPSTTPPPAAVDDRGASTPGADDPATHDAGDDHGADDPATHDAGGDHGADDPATHDAGDDHGTDDPATHDAGDDHGADD